MIALLVCGALWGVSPRARPSTGPSHPYYCKDNPRSCWLDALRGDQGRGEPLPHGVWYRDHGQGAATEEEDRARLLRAMLRGPQEASTALDVSHSTLGSPSDMPSPNNQFTGKAFTDSTCPPELVGSTDSDSDDDKGGTITADWRVFITIDRAFHDWLTEHVDPQQQQQPGEATLEDHALVVWEVVTTLPQQLPTQKGLEQDALTGHVPGMQSRTEEQVQHSQQPAGTAQGQQQ
jgi:hypothetical protein